MILVDTSVLLDVLRDDQEWASWSVPAFQRAGDADDVAINAVIYAEAASNYARIEDLDSALDTLEVAFLETPRPALFLAAHAFRRYRAAGGVKSNVLPNFFIGAHAAVSGATLLTRDPKRVKTYFPTVTIIAP